MNSTEFFTQNGVFVVLAIVLAVVFTWIGFRNPGNEPDSSARTIWTIADFTWLIVSFLAISRILSPVDDLLNSTAYKAAVGRSNLLKQDISRATWHAQDLLCIKHEALQSPVCRTLRELERDLVTPFFNHVNAHVNKENLDKICVQARCEPVVRDLKTRVDTFEVDYLGNRKILEGSNENGERKIIVAYAYLTIFTLFLGFRFGRTGAEWARNRDALVKHREKAGTAKQDDARHIFGPL